MLILLAVIAGFVAGIVIILCIAALISAINGFTPTHIIWKNKSLIRYGRFNTIIIKAVIQLSKQIQLE
ncbi:hypothetical protein C1N70_27545 (plasmid) [Cytobacillus firmus]